MSTKTNLYSVNQLRTITDENLPDIFGSLGFVESFSLVDFKLALGLITVALSGGLFLIEKKFTFDESYYITIVVLVLYFLTTGLLWIFSSTKKFKDIKYVGYNDANEKITCVTSTTKYDPIYNIELRFGENEREVKTTKVEFTKLFDEFTNFHPDNLKAVLNEEMIKVSKKTQ